MSTENVLNKFAAIESSVANRQLRRSWRKLAKTVVDQEENIRNAMEEQGSGSKQILESANLEKATAENHVNEISGRNREAIDVLLKEVSRFKVE